jgi:hypothetical protein
MKIRSCNNCQMAFFIDYGYSNYTVEGTYFCCGTNHHPEGSFDRFYGDDPRLEYGQQCPYYSRGKPVEIDVDRENLKEQGMTPAQHILWRQVQERPEPPALTKKQYEEFRKLKAARGREPND